jgi:hypothetical protein
MNSSAFPSSNPWRTARWVTPADCLGYPTVSASLRLLAFAKTPPANTPVMLSNSSSQRPFPWAYRQYSMMVNLLPALAPRDDLESAIAGILGPGGYTAVVRGYDNATGNALVEIYGVD